MRAILFDLDGTLIDSAPDLFAALNILLLECGRSPLPYLKVRNHVSQGSPAMIRLGFGEILSAEEFETRRLRLLDIYFDNICVYSKPFPGIMDLLDDIEERGLLWGIVTNKPGWLTVPLIKKLGLYERAGCIVSGDTTDHRKPHPEPLLHAARMLNVTPAACLYLGDDPRDIQAGNSADMTSIIAGYGYIDGNQDLESWAANGLIQSPKELSVWLPNREAVTDCC